ncbi:unnamed protein product [Pipistrellus nathusii]|uniref:Uncharacterized protein n=1 Tax=Pipistrellus nathusii TaxID=59473 RepID=A0ABN9ZIF0_PIPNA
MCGAGGPPRFLQRRALAGQGSWGCPPGQKRAAHLPAERERGGWSSFSFMKRPCPQPLVRAVPAWLESMVSGSRRLSCKVSHHAQQPSRAAPSSSAAQEGLSEPHPLPAQPSCGHGTKEGKAPEPPRGQPRPSPGEPHSEPPHSLQIGSRAPLPNPTLIRTTCVPG